MNPQSLSIARQTNDQTTPATPTHLKWRRALLAACIVLGPLTLTLYVVTWTENIREPLIASAAAGPTLNLLHFIGGVAASFFLPLGYLGMSLLGMRRAPGLATVAAALSLIGWIPWSALIGSDDLAFDINQLGATRHATAIWAHFNGDAVLSTYLMVYIIGHLVAAVLLGVMLGRLHIIPAWAAWAFALTSPLTMALFPIHILAVQNAIKYLTCALWIAGAAPAALAMLRGRD